MFQDEIFMQIVTERGIYTAELCDNSKKYLSCLLVGKTRIKPNFLAWTLFLTAEFNLNPFYNLPISSNIKASNYR